MSDAVVLGWLAFFTVVVVQIGGIVIVLLQSRKNYRAINGRMNQLLEAKSEESRLKGIMEGRGERPPDSAVG